MSMNSYCMFMYLHRASWHSSANLTEVYVKGKGKVIKLQARCGPEGG